MKNFIAIVLSAVIMAVSIPFIKPAKSQAFHWWWQEEVWVAECAANGVCVYNGHWEQTYSILLLNKYDDYELWVTRCIPESCMRDYLNPDYCWTFCYVTVSDKFLEQSWFSHQKNGIVLSP